MAKRITGVTVVDGEIVTIELEISNITRVYKWY